MFKYLFLFFLFVSSVYSNSVDLTIKEKEFIQSNPIINVGAETNWPPFDFVENGQYTGIARDYLDLIEKNTGLTFNYITSDSWDTLLDLSKNKQIDLLPVLVKNDEREEFLTFTNDYISIRAYLYSKNNFKNLNELENKIIAIPSGYSQGDFLNENYPNIKILKVNSILDALDSVITNKADALISNPAIINYLMQKNSLTGVHANFSIKFNSNKLHMATRKDMPVLRDIIQKTLDNFSEKEKRKIINTWIGNLPVETKLTQTEKNYIANNKQIIVANELDWVPYDYNENGKPKGYIIDYVKLIFSKVGFEPVFVTDSWKNLYASFKEGDIDLLPVLTYNEKREKELRFTNSYLKQNHSIITKLSNTDILSLDDLNGRKVVLVKGWNSTNTLVANYPKIEFILVDKLDDVFTALVNNVASATIQNKILAQYTINKKFRDKLKISADVVFNDFKNELYMAVQKENKILESIINKSMLKVSEDELNAIDLKWIRKSKEINFTDEELAFIDSKIVNVAFTPNWAPISFISDNKPYGLGFDFWSYVVDKANLKTNNNSQGTFTGALNSIRNKDNDVIITTSKTKERSEYAIFSDSYYKAPMGIATLKDQNFIPNASYLIGKKVAVGKNYTAYHLLKKSYPKIDFVPVLNIEEGLELLSQNKVFALVDNMPILTYNIKKNGFSDIKISGNTGIDFNLQVMIRDDYEILQSIINKVLRRMSPSEKEEIFNKWSTVEYTQTFDYTTLWKYFLPLGLIIIIILYKNRQLLNYQKTLKLTQLELEYSLNSFKTLVDLTIEGIFIVVNKEIVFVNKETLRIFNKKNERDLLEMGINEFFQEKEKDNINEIIENADSKTYEITALRNKDVKFPAIVKSQKIMFEYKQADIILIIDMSEIKAKENLLIQQSKMASLGEMIGNIAHQWRQPLSFISTAASGLKLQKEFNQLNDQVFTETLDGINETTKFLSQTIEDFQNYLKEDKQKNEFNINTCVEKILNIVKGSFINHSINVKLDLEENLIIHSYENELNQALLNILNNSKDALCGIDINNRYISIKTKEENSKYIIEIIDNAGGIDINIIDKLFEPYFTTKHKSQGTGLGLYMTHKIITESMEGEIKISNISYAFEDVNYDKCTKVLISLPLY